jgi:hypothetical protein
MSALDREDKIIYNAKTGGLFYAADGRGGVKAIHFASVDAGLALMANDFLVV